MTIRSASSLVSLGNTRERTTGLITEVMPPGDRASRLARYAVHIRAAWKRLYPATYAKFLAEGTLDEIALRAADKALEELALTRGWPKSEREARIVFRFTV